MIKIWLDDVRPVPDGFKLYQTAEELIKFLKKENQNSKYLTIDLDHDLGENMKTGLDVLDYIDEKTNLDSAYIPPVTAVHTDNAAVFTKMKNLSDKLNKLRKDRLFYLEMY